MLDRLRLPVAAWSRAAHHPITDGTESKKPPPRGLGARIRNCPWIIYKKSAAAPSHAQQQCRRAAAPCRSRLRHPSRAAAELLGSTTEIKPGVSFLSTVRARTKA